MVGKKLWFLAGLISAVGIMAGCDDDDTGDQCDYSNFMPYCIDASGNMAQTSDRQAVCRSNGMLYTQLCSNGCFTLSSGKSECRDDGYEGGKDDEVCSPACRDYQTCVKGQCVDLVECVDDTDCGAGKTCDNGVCKAVEKPECEKDADCGEGKVCSNGVCRTASKPECEKDADCGDGKVCSNGVCRTASKPDSSVTVEKCGSGLSIGGTDTCERTGTGSKLVIRGDILTKDKIYEGGSVVISGEKIVKVGCIEDADMADATVITCPDAVVSAGLLNGHDHITYTNQGPDSWGDERFDHRHDWRKSQNGHTNHNAQSTKDNETGELRQLLSGTTAVFGSGSVTGLIRNIDKEKAYGSHPYPNYQTFPLNDGGGTTRDSGCSYNEKGFKLGSSSYPFGPHIGEGINQAALNELRCLSGEGSGSKNIFTDKLAIIHGVAATPAIVKKMADAGSKLIWSPRTNISLYGDTARIPLYKNMGVTIGLGTDWTASGSVNMLREMQCADFLNTYYFDNVLSDFDIWKMATYNTAVALGYDDVAGDLANGYYADIAVYKKSGNQAHRAVIDAAMKDVAAVVLNGKLVYGDANLVTGENAESFDMCGVAKKIDTRATGTSMTFATIRGRDKFETFYCDAPSKEPTCIPMRPRPQDTTAQKTTQYGVESYKQNNLYSDPNDIDGDGIPNDQDNCPSVFNPVRPLDLQNGNPLQSDVDGDGYGDECDAYPFDASRH